MTIASRLLEKRREMEEVEAALKAERDVRAFNWFIALFKWLIHRFVDIKEFLMKTESLNQRKQELYKKEYQFKVSVHNMDKYLKVSFLN